MNFNVKNIRVSIFIFLLLNVIGFSIFSFAEENSQTSKSIFLDSDQDNLSDEEEKTYGTDPYKQDTDGDSYSDGAEVKSGYDPMKPAPGDRIISGSALREDTKNIPEEEVSITQDNETGSESEEQNLTEEMSDKVAKLVNDAAAENKQITMDDLDLLLNDTLSNSFSAEDLPVIDESLIKIKKQDYSKLDEKERLAKEKEDALNYLTSAFYVIINNAPQKVSSQKDVESMFGQLTTGLTLFSSNLSEVNILEPYSDMATKSYDELLNIEVPEKYLDTHKKGLAVMKEASALDDEINIDNSDPLAGIVVFSKFQGIMSMVLDLSHDMQNELAKLGVEEVSELSSKLTGE